MKILAIGGSNSKQSINRTFATYVAQLFENASILTYDISSLQIPLYSIDQEGSHGIPSEVHQFASHIDQSDLIVLSLAENNGSFNVGFKNLLDWTSRIKDRKTFNGKAMFLLATSPGARGGETVLSFANQIFPYAGANVKTSFSLPSFYQNFHQDKGILQEELLSNLKIKVNEVRLSLNIS